MASKRMTKEEHYAEYLKYNQIARDNLRAFNESYDKTKVFDWSKFEAYKENNKLANRHLGVKDAMWKKEMKKLYGYTG